MTDRTLKYGLLAGGGAALFWAAADMLLVGFVPRPEAYPLFSQTLANRLDANMAVLMLEGSPQRLLWGVCLATFSVVLYLLAVPALRRLLPFGGSGHATVFLLLFGYATSPVGHAGFGFVGLQAQSLLHAGASVNDAQVAVFNQFKHWLDVHWLVSVSASILGWLLLLLQTLRGRTLLPRWTAAANPLLLAPVLGGVCALFPGLLGAVLIGCASLNIAQMVFFAVALWLVSCRFPKKA